MRIHVIQQGSTIELYTGNTLAHLVWSLHRIWPSLGDGDRVSILIEGPVDHKKDSAAKIKLVPVLTEKD